MKKHLPIFFAFGLVVFFTIITFASIAQNRITSSRKPSIHEVNYRKSYNPNKIVQIAGTIEAINKTPSGSTYEIYLEVKTNKKKQVTAALGPAWYLNKHDFSPKIGDNIDILGSNAEINNSNVVIGAELKDKNNYIIIRDIKTGIPKWKNPSN